MQSSCCCRLTGPLKKYSPRGELASKLATSVVASGTLPGIHIPSNPLNKAEQFAYAKLPDPTFSGHVMQTFQNLYIPQGSFFMAYYLLYLIIIQYNKPCIYIYIYYVDKIG